MKSSKYTAFQIEGKNYCFSKDAFKRLFHGACKEKEIKGVKMEELIADGSYVTPEAVKSWKKGYNGPSSLETIQSIAKVLGVNDWMLLLNEVEEKQDMEKYNERQLVAIKKIYDAIIEFLSEFSNTDGFTDYWLDLKDKGSEDPEMDLSDIIDKKIDTIRTIIDKEYFDLKNTEIYDALQNYVEEDLINAYDGKLSYAYRFEAMPGEQPTTTEDYTKAMQSINKIIESC